MPINSTLLYIKGLLDGLSMPYGLPNLVAYINPPAVDEEPFGEPRAYVWPTTFEESRNPDRGGTVNRALSKPIPGANPDSGTKPIDHAIHVWIIYDQANDAANADSVFPAVIDAIGWQLRVSTDAVFIVDPVDGTQSTLIDVGETINGQITVTALTDQQMYRFDALISLPILELIRS